MARVLVVTRTRDRPVFLARALQSVHRQTMGDYDHVIVNDGGDPAHVDEAIRRAGLEDDRRIRVINVPESSGREAATNLGIRSASSEFVAVHDDDDSWHPEFLERTTARLGSPEPTLHSTHGVVVRTEQVSERITPTGIVETGRSTLFPRMRAISLLEQCTTQNRVTPITFLYTRAAYDALGGYDESLDVVGDWDFGIRFLLRYEIAYLDPGRALAYYHRREFDRARSDNSSFAGNDSHRVTSTMLMNRYLREELNDGRLGVGFLMSLLQHEDDRLSGLARRILPQRIVSAVGARWYGA